MSRTTGHSNRGMTMRQTKLGLLYLLMIFFLAGGFLSSPLQAQTTGVGGDATINKCETKTYTITITNDSGNDLTNLVITNDISLLVDFSYVTGTTSMDVTGNPGFCTANPGGTATSLEWDIDALCAGPITLANGEQLDIEFDLSSGCAAVSASMNVNFAYDIGGTPSTDDSAFSVEVLPGGVTIKKTPNVSPEYLGDPVTWTLTVENTGLGIIENVEVTDILGSGLTYDSSTQSGSNAGQTTTWTSAEYPALASMDPGDILTMEITAIVDSCTGLDNTADVRWGCNPSPANTCFDTAGGDGGTATASVQRIARTPLIVYNPPDITFDYCVDTENVSFLVSNDGDGEATNVRIAIDFPDFVVANVSAGASYNTVDDQFEITDPIAAGGNYTLSFDLTYSTSWCAGGFPTGDLLWQTIYRDECLNDFYPPVQFSTMNAPNNTPSVSMTKGGAAGIIQIADQVTYNITSSYTDDATCTAAGVVTVTDTVPVGFTVTDADGGVWTPGGGGTGGTIVWTYDPPASLNVTIILQSPGRDECQAYCQQPFINSVDASVTDCCGCTLTANASQAGVIECEELVDSDKGASPVPVERCDVITYTNSYTFENGSGITLDSLIFTEDAGYDQQYLGGIDIELDNIDLPVCYSVTNNTPGGGLIVDFSGCAATVLDNSTLDIVYDLRVNQNDPAACSDQSFVSWSHLDLNTSTGSDCLPDGVIHEATAAAVEAPSMSIGITGLGNIVHTCESQTITINVARTSATAMPQDVVVRLSGLNYYVVDVGATNCGGSVSPVSCTPTAVDVAAPIGETDYYQWVFNDVFAANGDNATLQLDVMKRCSGTGDVVATVYYDDTCNDDDGPDVPELLCSTSATETPALLMSGDLLIEKTPEVYYADTNTATWTVYVTNRGTGTAFNTWLDDTLGIGLAYNDADVVGEPAIVPTVAQDHDANAINGFNMNLGHITAGQRKEITVVADVIDCDNLTNDVSTSWGCGEVGNIENCRTAVTDTATVEIPAPLLVHTNVVTTPVNICATPEGKITVRNAGQTTVYNVQITETLPEDLLYIDDSTSYDFNGGGEIGPDNLYDPTVGVNTLHWDSGDIPVLASLDPGDTVDIYFDLDCDCPFLGGTVTVATSYENPCGVTFNVADSNFTVVVNEPQITIDKYRSSEPIDCTQDVVWTIDVTNTSGYPLDIVYIEDVLGGNYTYDGSTGGVDGGYNDGASQNVTWEIVNLAHNATETLTLTAIPDSAPCSADLDNTVTAYYGCGVTDNDSETKPGVDEAGNCVTDDGETDTDTPTREPDLAALDIDITPGEIDTCETDTTVTLTITNQGATDASNLDVVVTLPPGLSFLTGTADVTCGGVLTDPIPDPTLSGPDDRVLTFTNTGDTGDNLCDLLEDSLGNNTLVLRFDVQSSCYTDNQLDFVVYYYDCCGDNQWNTTGTSPLLAYYPDLTVTKTPATDQIACAGQQSWTITVTNNGDGQAEVVQVIDTLGDWLDVDLGASSANLTAMPLISAQTYGWEINNLPPLSAAPANEVTFTLVATLNPDLFPNQNDCNDAPIQNDVEVYWHCGTIGDATDNDPTSTTNYNCTNATADDSDTANLTLPNLEVTDITAAVNCTADGSFSDSITLTISNSGTGSSTGSFDVEVTIGAWTGTGSYNGTIASGGTQNVTIDTTGWNPGCNGCVAYTIAADVDTGNTICECDETDNDTYSENYTPQIPDLIITDIDFSGVTHANDVLGGNVTVTVENQGCAAAGAFDVGLGTDGCLTFSTDQNVAGLAAGASTDVTFPISDTWSDCTDGSCDFTATVDVGDAVCECTATNTRTETYTDLRANLQVADIDFSSLCNNDTVDGTVDVTVTNNGTAAAGAFEISLVTGGCLTFSANQNVGSLAVGASTTVTFTPDAAWADCATCNCQFTATVDATNTVDECDGTDNTRQETFAGYPNLTVDAVASSITCLSDGSLTGTDVTVSNTGCAVATNAVVRLASDCGLTFADQTITLAAGQTETVFFPFTSGIADCSCTFTAVIDPDNTICECDGTDNTNSSVTAMLIPDLEVQAETLVVNCMDDGVIDVSGTITLVNNGCGPNFTENVPVRLSLYSGATCGGNLADRWTFTLRNVDIVSGGGIQTFSIPNHNVTYDVCSSSADCRMSVLIEADYNDSICEWDGTDNTYCATMTSDCLDVAATSLTAATNGTADGQINPTITVEITNSGNSPITEDFAVRVDDGQGWGVLQYYNADLGGPLPLAVGATASVTFQWTRDFDTDNLICDFDNISAMVDAENTMCQCTTDNDTITAAYELEFPNLLPTAIGPQCNTDGTYNIDVTVQNNGCGTAGGFTVHLEDNLGNSADLRVDSLDSGFSTTVTFDSWPATCEPPSVTFTATVDTGEEVVEFEGGDNSTVYVYNNTSPDLVFTSAVPSCVSTGDGGVTGSFSITLENQGNGPATEDFKIIIDDGKGWNTEKFYAAGLGGSLPVNVGDSVTVRVPWTRDFTSEPFTCDFNDIAISIDMETSVCECTDGNNETTASYRLPFPDLSIDTLMPTCTADGMQQLSATVSNKGCEDVTEDFNITFTDSTGQTQTVSFTALGGSLPLTVGQTVTLNLGEWTFDCGTATVQYTGTIDVSSLLGDLVWSNNTITTSGNNQAPDLQMGDVQWTCNSGGTVTFTATIVNSGNEAATDVPFTGYDPDGNVIYNDTVTLAAGASTEVTFTTGAVPQNQELTFRFVIDENDTTACECNGANNEITVTIICDEGGVSPINVGITCGPAHQPGGLFTFNIQISNFSDNPFSDIHIEDVLPEGFQYVEGSSVLAGQTVSDPQLSGLTLTWTIDSLDANTTVQLAFSAVADADIDPGRYCTQAMGSAVVGGGATRVETTWVECCSVVSMGTGAGCCLQVEEWPFSPFHRPQGPVSFVEPYFHTESAMFTAYAIFNLWNDTPPEKETMPHFMRERLLNYARSTIEEFYLNSRLGLTLADGTVWLSHGGGYPEQQDPDNATAGSRRWKRNQVDETMTVSQVGFELLALKEAVNVEKRKNVQERLTWIIEKKLDFLKDYIASLPHGWELQHTDKTTDVKEAVKKLDGEATLYDRASLYLALVELGNGGYKDAADLAKGLRPSLRALDDESFDNEELRSEFMFTLALLKGGQKEQATAKMKAFETLYNSEKEHASQNKDQPGNASLQQLHDYALAHYLSRETGLGLTEAIEKEMKTKFYLSDSGIYAEKQPDFTHKMALHSLAPLLLSFDTGDTAERDGLATILYRIFDEVGLFLKKRNLMEGKPLYSLLKNYPFSEEVLPILPFTKAKRDIAPVFSRDALVHSTRVKPIGEVLIPQDFSRILSPGYETDTARISSVSHGLQVLGRLLAGKGTRALKEEGRSLDESGKKYLDALMKSGAGILVNGTVALPFGHIATMGPKDQRFNLEPLDSNTNYHTAGLANYLTAGRAYLEGDGKYAEDVRGAAGFLEKVIRQFEKLGYVPESFGLFVNESTGEIKLSPSEKKASKLVIARLYFALKGTAYKEFLADALKDTTGVLRAEDLVYIASAPELVEYFKTEIRTLIDRKDSNVSDNAADVVGRRLLGDSQADIDASMNNLRKHWDKEAVLPKSDRIENIEQGLIYHHEPEKLLLYLLALKDTGDFRFMRTLNFFTYLLENEWGVEWRERFLTFPSAEYRVVAAQPREHVEPGDIVNFRVRVDNTCPEGLANSIDLPSVYLRARFSPSLNYMGTQLVDGLTLLSDFQWQYLNLFEGKQLEYVYQAYIPDEFAYNFVDGFIYAGSRQGAAEFGPETGTGDTCEDTDAVKRLNFVPFSELQGVVFEDRNVNGTKETGEPGIPNILFKDTRGRMFRSDADGRFTVMAGHDYEAIQMELKSLPAHFLVATSPTRMVNRNYVGDISFPLVPCNGVTGFVYLDANGNKSYDDGETKPAGVLLKAKDKEVATGGSGQFIFRNLPVLWQEWIEIKKDQPYYDGPTENLRIQVNKK